jgi:hypothetical protein
MPTTFGTKQFHIDQDDYYYDAAKGIYVRRKNAESPEAHKQIVAQERSKIQQESKEATGFVNNVLSGGGLFGGSLFGGTAGTNGLAGDGGLFPNIGNPLQPVTDLLNSLIWPAAIVGGVVLFAILRK